jgi:glucose-6-phosphate isomerase
VSAVQAIPTPTRIDWISGQIHGTGIEQSTKKLGQLAGLFLDGSACEAMDPEMEIYTVRFWRPVPDGTIGGLFWGTTTLQPGMVGDEYFMTHGHFHARPDRAEFYATVRGSGRLILIAEDGETTMQTMTPGSVHYIPGFTAHRVANTGTEPLVFVASWPSDAGHDYARVRKPGFGKRLLRRDGHPCLL